MSVTELLPTFVAGWLTSLAEMIGGTQHSVPYFSLPCIRFSYLSTVNLHVSLYLKSVSYKKNNLRDWKITNSSSMCKRGQNIGKRATIKIGETYTWIQGVTVHQSRECKTDVIRKERKLNYTKCSIKITKGGK